jgi:excinuclease ABC subunit C
MIVVSDTLKEKVYATATSAGVYLMKDAQGKVIYVGKARNLKKRLASYFLKSKLSDVKTGVLVGNISTFETILTSSEHEALILESNLIKQYRPKYNVILKDDKRYPILRLDTASRYPTLKVVRKIQKDDALYFGPFSSAGAVQQTLKMINRTFNLRKCKGSEPKPRSRPCLHHQMNQCLAPCCLEVGPERYREIVREVILFLNGRTTDLVKKIRQEMSEAAERQEFELAAGLRDKIFALEKILQRQVVVSSDLVDRDVLGISTREDRSILTILFVRSGKLVGTRHFAFSETASTEPEMVETFLLQYYERTPFIPPEILLPMNIEHRHFLEARVSEYRGRKVRIATPARGEKKKIVTMAMENANNRLSEEIINSLSGEKLLKRLKKSLSLTDIPLRIECFDNSHLFGSHNVSARVVFENASPKKSDYRKYNLRDSEGPDDYASMNEVLTRRFKPKDGDPEPLPDLLMVDGGKGQLNIAISVVERLGILGKIDIIGIAKKEEERGETQDKIFLPGRSNPVNFGNEMDLLMFLQKIRDEAHRFAISHYRKKHRSDLIGSALDAIPGIGEKRKKTLFNHFKTIENIRNADISEIAALPGFNRNVAEVLSNRFRKR